MQWKKFMSAGIRMPFYMSIFVKGFREQGLRVGLKLDGWVSITDKQLTSIYYHPKNDLAAKNWIARLLKKTSIPRILAVIKGADSLLLKFCHSVRFRDCFQADKNVLSRLLNKFVALLSAKFGLYPFPKIMDGAISALLPTILKCAVPADDMSILISSTELGEYNRERIALLNIAKKVRQHELESLFKKTDEEVIEQLGRFHPALYCQIENYVRNFDWVPVSHHVQPLNLNLAIAGVRKTFSDNNFSVELKNLLNGPGEISRARQKLLKKYKFSRAELNILEYLRGINISNDGRKAAMSRAILWSYPLFQAIADRVGMDVISLRQLNYRQMGDYLMNEKSRPRLKKVINERFGYYYCLLSRGKIVDGSGDKARKFVDKFLGLGHEEVKEVKGAVAYRGKVKGRVRVIKMEYQAQNLLEGEILVSSMTDPDMVPAMKRAAAIVTDEGGLICHAAIVAREMKKPCVIATKIATKIFKDGDMVEVDAEKGIVRKI